MWWTLAAASIASATALLVAFVAYPYQKKKDRNLKEHSEKLAAYQRFVTSITAHHSLLASSLYEGEDAGILDAYPKVVASSYEVIFYGPPYVISACQQYLKSLLEYQNFVLGKLGSKKHASASVGHPEGRDAFKPSQKARRAAILSIRKDITNETEQAAQEAINAFFTMTPVEEKPQ
ncbi:hypothetical protein SAMN04488523_11063 [Sulfitobacter brevis]|uniref:Uncharacterized protein n=1 Tax=Sulfitobacter brevis TaxID=74348 RepID=A0A1I2D6Q5_9RHOB|nr:hypothetical protein [Sulfitobacter brevis]SFE76217.1 hypothetical protein SAMN04488523_11063 [Sulfitobacter brevis]